MKNIITAFFLLFFLSGCSRTNVSMKSEPSDAQVTINNKIIRHTPFTINYSNVSDKTVMFTVRKEGFETVHGVIPPEGGEFSINLGSSEIITPGPYITVENFMEEKLKKEIKTGSYKNQSHTMVIMRSEPKDAEITINDKLIRYTPFIVSYTNRSRTSVSFVVRKPGYNTVEGVIPPDGGDFSINLENSQVNISGLFVTIEGSKKEIERQKKLKKYKGKKI